MGIAAEAGDLAGILAYPFAERPSRAALIVGPHPLMGGRVGNNVVRGVGRGLAERGLVSLRFEFSGAGVTAEIMDQFWRTGKAPDDPQRATDARVALDWLMGVTEGSIVLVGYSFGASLLGALLDEPRVRGLALIGATFAQHDYTSAAVSGIPKLLIAADNDFATPIETTRQWHLAAAEATRLVVLPSTDHFYRSQEDRIAEEILKWLPF